MKKRQQQEKNFGRQKGHTEKENNITGQNLHFGVAFRPQQGGAETDVISH